MFLDGTSEKEPIFDLEKGKYYSNGNCKKLEEFISAQIGKENPKVSFVCKTAIILISNENCQLITNFLKMLHNYNKGPFIISENAT